MNATSGPYTTAHEAPEPALGQLPKGGGTILDAIGNTPLVMVDGIWVKLEFLNPSGSIKARIAKYMIERAEREGLLRPGDTIVEASSGNTGNAMSMVAAVKGYRMLVVMPDGMSGERLAISRAFGAQVMTLGDFHVNDALAKVAELGRQPGYFAPQQFDSEWNVEETAPGSDRRRSPSCTAWSRSVQTATTQRPWHECAPGVRHLGHLAYLICRVEVRRATSAAGAKSDVARASRPSWRPHAALQASLRLLRLRTQPDADRRAWSALRWQAREEPPFCASASVRRHCVSAAPNRWLCM